MPLHRQKTQTIIVAQYLEDYINMKVLLKQLQ